VIKIISVVAFYNLNLFYVGLLCITESAVALTVVLCAVMLRV
jgi:hypothetical protein